MVELGYVSQFLEARMKADVNSQVRANDPQAPDEVEVARASLASLDPSDDGYLLELQLLARKLASRFTLKGNPDDLEEAITRTRQTLDIAPPGDSLLGALSNMGGMLSKRFNFGGDANDLIEAIGYFQAAVESCPPEQPSYLSLVANLCSGLLKRYKNYGDVTDLDLIIEKSTFASSTSSAQSPNQDVLFNNWATALEERFEKLGNRDDLDNALMHYRSCLDLRPPDHPLRYTVLENLALAMEVRFEMDGHLQDLESAIDYFTSALQLRSPEQDGFVSCLTNLAMALVRLFNARGEIEKLEMAIDYYQTAMEHSTVPNLEHSRLLDNYASALQARFSVFGRVDDLDQGIQFLTTSSDITPPTYAGRPNTLFALGAALLNRFNATSNTGDLDSSIEKLASALQLSETGYMRPMTLSLYGQALSARFKARGDMHDLQIALSTCKDALALASPTEFIYPPLLANLSLLLYESYFYRSGGTEEITAIIDHCDRALASMLPINPASITLKTVRAQAFLQRALYEREEVDINTCVDGFREAIAMLPEGHTETVPIQWQLGLALQTRFQFNADTKDLDEAIKFYRIAYGNCERGNTEYVHVCMNLGNALREDFEFNHSDSLDESIVLLAEAENILSSRPGHSAYEAALVNLGIALSTRFQTQRSRDDLDAAIEYLTRAQRLPTLVEEFSLSFGLATMLSMRYDEYEDLNDLERSTQLFSIVAEQTPPKHLSRAALCRNYGHALYKLGLHNRDRLKNIDAAITLYRESLGLLPPSNYDHLITIVQLAWALHIRGQLLPDINDLCDAMNLLRSVLRGLPDGNPMFHAVCHTAAKLSMSMYTLSESQAPSFMEDGFRYYEKAAGYTSFHSYESVTAALEWVEYAEEQNHGSALLAYQTCLSSLNQHLLSTASIKSRRAALLYKRWVGQTGTLATDATACAISRGELELAVELSEQGRGLLWSQLARGSTPLDALRSTGEAGRELASNFERVSAELGKRTIMEPNSTLKTSRLTTEEAAQRYKQLSKKFQDIVARIRQQDGFGSFLDRLSFQSLQRAAIDGPIILVNASRRRCNALIILHDSPPRLVPLPGTTLEDLTKLSGDMYQMLKATSRVGEERIRERELVVFLRTLWDTVVSPIVDELTGLLPRGARIWWCPTSTLTTLPLHAAGPYRKGAMNLANIYVSSYTPTLAALIRARHRPSSTESTRTPTTFTAIGQAKASSSAPELQTVDMELTLVQSLLPPSMAFSALSGDASTADAALTALRTHGWAHLACHGHPNVEQPFDSSFALGDRALTVLDIVGGRTDTGVDTTKTVVPEFAFLSACHTAVGDRYAPDEVIHLAAAMQFAGFRSVIGTMWAVDDAMAQETVKAFYTHLFSPSLGGGEGGVACTMAARALNRAGKSVDNRVVTIDQRIVFIHIGA